MGSAQDSLLKQMLTQAKQDQRFFAFVVGKGNEEFMLLLAKTKLNKGAVDKAWAERIKELPKPVALGKVYFGLVGPKPAADGALEFRFLNPKTAPTTLAKFIKLSMKGAGFSANFDLVDGQPDEPGDELLTDDQRLEKAYSAADSAKESKASSGTPDTQKADALSKAAQSWFNARSAAVKQLRALQSAVSKEPLAGAAAAAKSYDKLLASLSGDQLDKALNPQSPDVAEAARLTKQYQTALVTDKKLIEHAETNPFGVQVQITLPLSEALSFVAEKALA